MQDTFRMVQTYRLGLLSLLVLLIELIFVESMYYWFAGLVRNSDIKDSSLDLILHKIRSVKHLYGYIK